MQPPASKPPVHYLLDYIDHRPLPDELVEICRQLLPLVLRETGADTSGQLRRSENRGDEIERALLQLRSSGGTACWLIDRLHTTTDNNPHNGGQLAGRKRSQLQQVEGNLNVSLQVGESVHGDIHLGTLPHPKPIAPAEEASSSSPAGQLAARPLRPSPQQATPRPSPDLEIEVTEAIDSGCPSLIFEVTASDAGWSLDHRRFGPLPLHREPNAYVKSLFETIEARRSLSGSRDADLRDLGADLARQLLGADLSELLWNFQHRATTLLIGASPPWIPWELIYLPGPSSAGRFLCEAFALSRWPSELPAAMEFPLRRLAVVTPASDDRIAVREELAFLHGLQGPARSICPIDAHYEPLVEAMASGGYDGWQFIGHGRTQQGDANSAVIGLEPYQVLTPKVLSREASGLGRSRPLVFFNGCHTGRAGAALNGAGGWAHQFLGVGAGAFLGAQWQVNGQRAASFARVFYECFFAGAPIAHAVRRARQAVREPGDSTWLAYALYAHPLASTRPFGRQ